MKMICASFIAALLLTVSGAQAGQSIADSLNGKLVAVQGGKFADYDAKQLAGKKYFAVYLSANWCPPCHVFTPKLVEFYKQNKKQHPEFEVIMVSDDESENAMLDYMKSVKMQWPAVKFSDRRSVAALNQYLDQYLPQLVFISADGALLSAPAINGKFFGSDKVLDDIKKTLQKQR